MRIIKCFVVFFFICSLSLHGQEAEVIWSDEFDGNALDTTKWLYETGAHGWGNNEWQDYTKGQNVEVRDGILYIIAKKKGKGQKAGAYSSSRLNSRASFIHSRIEVRAKMPKWKGAGLWPAIWMLGENISDQGWPACGELDIMEYVSFDPGIVHQTIHSEANNHMKGTHISSGPVNLSSIEEEFHIYGLEWTKEYLQFYVDSRDNILLSVPKPSPSNPDNWPFDQPFYLLLNVAVGGSWGGQKGVDDSIFPAAMEVDYVRVYDK